MARLNGRAVVLATAMALLIPAATMAADGERIYTELCSYCHDDGTVGAPIKGDKSAWAPRIAKGRSALYDSALIGLGHMLPRQNRRGYGAREIKDAVDYLIEEAH